MAFVVRKAATSGVGSIRLPEHIDVVNLPSASREAKTKCSLPKSNPAGHTDMCHLEFRRIGARPVTLEDFADVDSVRDKASAEGPCP